MHILITGDRHAGKSTLIRELAQASGRPLFGYISQKEPALTESDGNVPIYIYAVNEPRVPKEECRVGVCRNGHFTGYPEAFERFAPRLKDPPAGSLVVMDEIGFMEGSSEAFKSAVFALLDGDVPVLASVKPDDFPFPNAVRAHPNCRLFELTKENREEVREAVTAFMRKEWMK